MDAKVVFSTNIDCCKQFMRQISGAGSRCINPLIGDNVVVYQDAEFILEMKVVGRTWQGTHGNHELKVELHLPSYFDSIAKLEEVLRRENFNVHP